MPRPPVWGYSPLPCPSLLRRTTTAAAAPLPSTIHPSVRLSAHPGCASPCGPFERSEIRAKLNPNPYVNRTPDPTNRIPHFVRSVRGIYFIYPPCLPIRATLSRGRFRSLLKLQKTLGCRARAKESARGSPGWNAKRKRSHIPFLGRQTTPLFDGMS